MGKTHFIAFDLGATSGRCILGSLSEQGLELKELSRFPNRILHIGDRFFWNIFSLYEHILDGLKASSKENVHITSIGIDTWGVDIAFIGRDGDIIGLPRSYRDPYTENIPEDFFSRVMPEDRLYGATGIQIMDFNTLFQLYAMKQEKSPALEAAERILFMPDVLSYMLTGQKVTEYTIASTSGFVNPYTKEIDRDILEKAGIAPELFGEITMPGKSIGILKDEIAAECELEKGIPVIAVAGHDTGSAVAAVPATDKGFAYLSSGTWSLMGIETCRPVINEETYRLNITNEGGVDGTIRLLKNITGMWILENCMKEWEREVFRHPGKHDSSHKGILRKYLPAYTGDRRRDRMLHIRKSCAQIQGCTFPAPKILGQRNHCPAHNRRRLQERCSQPIYRRRHRKEGDSRTVGSHCHREHNDAGTRSRSVRFSRRDETPDRRKHQDQDISSVPY